MNDDNRTTAIGLARYAREFFDAALAADDKIGRRPGYDIVAPPPVMFLVAHSIELTLKAYLRHLGLTVTDIVELKHDLNKAWRRASELGLRERMPLTKDELETLCLISKLHSSTELRYIRTGYKTLPVFGPLQELCAKFLDNICPLVGYDHRLGETRRTVRS